MTSMNDIERMLGEAADEIERFTRATAHFSTVRLLDQRERDVRALRTIAARYVFAVTPEMVRALQRMGETETTRRDRALRDLHVWHGAYCPAGGDEEACIASRLAAEDASRDEGEESE